MKKFLTLVLALVMVLALAAPAMAFTSDTDPDEPSTSAFELDIFLVDYDEGVFGSGAYLPPADRGYAKNEIVAAVVELVVPKDTDATDLANFQFEVTGESVKMQPDSETTVAAAPLVLNVADNVLGLADETVSLVNTSTTKTKTFKWLVFAKVTGDDASLTASLTDADNEGDLVDGDTVTFTVGDNDYTVSYTGGVYTIVPKPAPAAADEFKGVEVEVSTKTSTKWDGKAIRILFDDDGNGANPTVKYTVGFYLNGDIFFKAGSTIIDDDTAGSLYDDLVDLYEDVVVDDLGLDATLSGKVKPSYFEGQQSADSVEATVDIEPWTAYVTVPDNIVVDPPKTGDAASILGFVMIVLAAAAVVAVRKVRA